jgi:sulfate permease, SulP family
VEKLFSKIKKTFLGDMIGGLTSSVVAIAYGLTFSNLIFSEQMKPWSGYGLAATFLAMAIASGVMALRSSIPFVIAGLDGATAAVTASLVSALIMKLNDMGNPDDLLAPVMIVIALSTGLTGLVLWVLGAFRAANAIRFIPFPVIGGFLAATGWLMINGGIRIVLDQGFSLGFLTDAVQNSKLEKISAAVVLAFLINGLQRFWRSPYVLPFSVVSSVIIAHLYLLFSGLSFNSSAVQEWFVHAPREVALVTTWELGDIWLFPWGILPSLAGDIFAVVFVTAITMLLNTNSIELISRKDADLKIELEAIGIANLLSALFGGYVGCTSLSRTTLNYAAGGRGRLSGIIVALISTVIIYIGANFTNYVPKFVLGGLIITLGTGIIKKWLIDAKRLIPWHEYFVLLSVTLVILHWGFIAGIFVGILIGCITFAYGASRTNAIKFCFDGAEYRSSLDRGSDELAILSTFREEVQGFILQSYLFFGTSNKLYEHVKLITHQRLTCKFLVFDFSLVNGIDSSAFHSFRQIKQLAKERAIRLVMVNAAEDHYDDFSAILSQEDWLLESLDQAIEACENDIISRHHQVQQEGRDLLEWLERDLGSLDFAEKLVSLCEKIEIKKGTTVAQQGAVSDSMHFILSGRLGVVVQIDDSGFKRVRSLGRHTTVGEMGFLTRERRSASIIAEEDSIIYQLSLACFERIKKEDPDLCEALLSYVILLLSQRLRFASNTIAMLQR